MRVSWVTYLYTGIREAMQLSSLSSDAPARTGDWLGSNEENGKGHLNAHGLSISACHNPIPAGGGHD